LLRFVITPQFPRAYRRIAAQKAKGGSKRRAGLQIHEAIAIYLTGQNFPEKVNPKYRIMEVDHGKGYDLSNDVEDAPLSSPKHAM
jgi:hypothetical protein